MAEEWSPVTRQSNATAKEYQRFWQSLACMVEGYSESQAGEVMNSLNLYLLMSQLYMVERMAFLLLFLLWLGGCKVILLLVVLICLALKQQWWMLVGLWPS